MDVDTKSQLVELGIKASAVLLPALLAVLCALMYRFAQWIGVSKDKAGAEHKNTVWLGLSQRATHFTAVVIQDLQTGMRKQYEAAAADGKLTDAEKKALRDEALRRIKALLGTAGLEELKGFLGDVHLDDYLGGLIETVLGGIKLDDKKAAALEVAANPAPFATK